MTYQRTAEFANTLYEAALHRAPVDPFTSVDPFFSVDDAYEVQACNVQRWTKEGRVVSGKKIGLTSKAMQAQLGINEPDYGQLFSDMDRSADGKIQTGEFIQPKIEAEIAFILKEDLSGGNVTIQDVLSATDYAVCAFEIVDSRFKDWRYKLPDTVADNASSGCYMLGGQKLRTSGTDLASIGMKLFKNGELAGEGVGAAVMGNPAHSVAWLSNKLWNYGVTLKKGEVVLSGALSGASMASRGDVYEARFSGLGSILAEFV